MPIKIEDEFLNQARAWFLDITFTAQVYVYVYECVYAPEAIKTSGVILALYDWLNNSGCFSVPFYESCRRCHH